MESKLELDILHETIASESAEWRPALDVLLGEGCLARRIVRALKPRRRAGDEIPRAELREVYGALADRIAAGGMFVP